MRAAAAPAGRPTGRGRWQLRSYLAGLLALFVTAGAVAVGAGWILTERDALAAARTDAEFGARQTAAKIGQNGSVVRSTVDALASNPGAGRVFTDPSTCQLAFNLGGPDDGHLDLLRPDGTVVCSSRPLVGDDSAAYRTASWLQAATHDPSSTGPVADRRTGLADHDADPGARAGSRVRGPRRARRGGRRPVRRPPRARDRHRDEQGHPGACLRTVLHPNRPGHGTGLGLAPIYGIITQIGGQAQIYSELGHGTTVAALLPITEDSVEPAGTATAAPPSGAGQRILLVEDDDSLRALTERVLGRNGYTVLAARSTLPPGAVLLNKPVSSDLLLGAISRMIKAGDRITTS